MSLSPKNTVIKVQMVIPLYFNIYHAQEYQKVLPWYFGFFCKKNKKTKKNNKLRKKGSLMVASFPRNLIERFCVVS